MRRGDPARANVVLADIARFALGARRVVARGRDRFLDPEDDEQRRIGRSLVIDLSTAADRLPESFRAQHPNVDWRGIRATRNFIAHDYDHVRDELLWNALAIEFPRIAAALDVA